MILEAYHPAPVRLFSSVDRQITLHFVAGLPDPGGRLAGSRPPAWPGSWPATTTPAASPPRSWPSGCARTCCPPRRAPSPGKSFSAQSFTRLLQLLNTQLADYDDAIAAAVAEHPDAPIFASFPGVGPVLTGVLLAEIGEDRTRFPTPAVLLAESGLAPVTRASGRSRQRPVPLRRQHPPARSRDVVGLQLDERSTLGGRRVP